MSLVPEVCPISQNTSHTYVSTGPRSHLRNEKLYLNTDIGRPLSVENWSLAQNMCTVLLHTLVLVLVLVLVGLIGGTGTRRDGTEVSFIQTKSCT
jgi:hypothetical protein